MGLTASKSSYKIAPEGMAVARCYRIIDLGSQWSERFKSSSPKIMISWELPDVLMEDGRPFSIVESYTLSLSEKASLRPHLESWRGRKFTDDEAKGFDVSKLIGQPCLINVVHSVDGQYANIGAITPMMKGAVCPPLINTPVILNLDSDKFDKAVYDALSDKLKEKIAASPEYKAIQSGGIEPPSGNAEDTDVPF